ADPGSPPASSPRADFDLIRALEERAGSLEVLESFRSPPFGVRGTALRIDGRTLQVYEYETPAAARVEADRFSSDGTRYVGPDRASSIAWVAPPHLHRRGRWIAVYVGVDADILRLLREIMGSQFAGA
ncbi:MAG TPA: hypothetical protein VLL48_12400, partial [Longimicrobiales bacterium]|nr:hypothetical protein [Longimicrobiales bacterium]